MYDKKTMEHLGLMVVRRCNYELSRVMGMRRWLTEMNATPRPRVELDVGDFVLVAKKETKDGHKLRLKWLRPQRVTRALSEHTYEVQDILTEAFLSCALIG